jgi:asparagine synthase (glutamine-hydrolysing)
MSGIAGIVELAGAPRVNRPLLRAMAGALAPDAYLAPEVGLCTLQSGTPGRNEDGSVIVVCQDRPIGPPGLGHDLPASGHQLGGGGDAEILAHLWEDHGPGMLDRLRGPFAFALWDARTHQLFLARDRIGTNMVFWAQRGNWLLFASEIKVLFASGLVRPVADRAGLDQVFTFIGLPTATTCLPSSAGETRAPSRNAVIGMWITRIADRKTTASPRRWPMPWSVPCLPVSAAVLRMVVRLLPM